MAEIAALVEMGEKAAAKRTIIVKSESWHRARAPRLARQPPARAAKDYCGPATALGGMPARAARHPRISGEEGRAASYLVGKSERLGAARRVDINEQAHRDHRLQMLRKVRIETVGDTGLLPGNTTLIEKQLGAGQGREDHEKGDSELRLARSCPRPRWNRPMLRLRPSAARPPGGKQAGHRQHAAPGHHEAAVQSSSFISAAIFQGPPRCSPRPVGKIDNLVGLKENVILGHLIPAGHRIPTIRTAKFASAPRPRSADPRPEPEVVQRFPLLEEGATARGRKETGRKGAPAGTALGPVGGGRA